MSRKVGWKIETGVSLRTSSSSWPAENSSTARVTMPATVSMIADRRSATSAMPKPTGQAPIQRLWTPLVSAW